MSNRTVIHILHAHQQSCESQQSRSSVRLGRELTRQGIYSIIIDSAPPQYFSGLANPNIFQQVLFATSTLAQGDHALRITNEGNRDAPDQPGLIWLDVDFVAVSGVM